MSARFFMLRVFCIIRRGEQCSPAGNGKALQEAMSKVENRVQELWDEAVAQGIRAENKESGSKKFASRYAKQGGDFSNALTGAEWSKFNNAITSGLDAGLRISDNALLVECEEGNIYDYKFIIYDNTFEDNPIKSIYAIGNLDYNINDLRTIAEYINGVEERRYAKQEMLKEVLRRNAEKFGYVLRRYNSEIGGYDHIGGTFTKNRADFVDKSNGAATYTAAGQIKYSDRVTQNHNDYLSAVERGDMKTAQKMTDYKEDI